MEKTSYAADTKLGRSCDEFGGHNQKKSNLEELEKWSGLNKMELFWDELEALPIEIECIKADCTISAETAVLKNRSWVFGVPQTEQGNNMLVFWKRWIFGWEVLAGRQYESFLCHSTQHCWDPTWHNVSRFGYHFRDNLVKASKIGCFRKHGRSRTSVLSRKQMTEGNHKPFNTQRTVFYFPPCLLQVGWEITDLIYSNILLDLM